MSHFDKNNPEWFRLWQSKHYSSKAWIRTRNSVRAKYGMRCCMCVPMVEISDRMICTNCQREVNNEFIKPCRVCLKMIKGKSIVDHIIPITPENYEEWDIVWNQDNLRLLCLDHHNKITFKYTKRKYNSKDIFDLDKRGDINLF